MLVIRIVGLMVLIFIAASVVAWLLTGDTRFRTLAARTGKIGLALLLLFLAFLMLERALIPLV